LLTLAVLIAVLWAVDAFIFHGSYCNAAWSGLIYATQAINGKAQDLVGRVNR
jgi:hypothetical protein